MAEAILRYLGGSAFEAYSAGSHPAGFVHELAIEAMRRLDIPMEEGKHTSKSWEAFKDRPIDLLITVCAAAAREVCPVWPQEALQANWPLPDPVGHLGTDDERIEFAVRVGQRLITKIQGLIDLDFSADAAELEKRLEFLGDI
jgi:arsenate reductase